MTRILFICLGNICRSPMAEYVMKDLTSKAGLSEQFEIASAATSAWEIGNRQVAATQERRQPFTTEIDTPRPSRGL